MKENEAMKKRLIEIREDANLELNRTHLDQAEFSFNQGRLNVVADVLGFIGLKKVDGEIKDD